MLKINGDLKCVTAVLYIVLSEMVTWSHPEIVAWPRLIFTMLGQHMLLAEATRVTSPFKYDICTIFQFFLMGVRGSFISNIRTSHSEIKRLKMHSLSPDLSF